MTGVPRHADGMNLSAIVPPQVRVIDPSVFTAGSSTTTRPSELRQAPLAVGYAEAETPPEDRFRSRIGDGCGLAVGDERTHFDLAADP